MINFPESTKKQYPHFLYMPAAENRKSTAAESPSPQLQATFFFILVGKKEAARERVQRREWSCSAALTGSQSSLQHEQHVERWKPNASSPSQLQIFASRGRQGNVWSLQLEKTLNQGCFCRRRPQSGGQKFWQAIFWIFPPRVTEKKKPD